MSREGGIAGSGGRRGWGNYYCGTTTHSVVGSADAYKRKKNSRE